MEHRQPTAESIVRSAHQGDYAVPEFQRGFVWTISQVKELADSLTRNYPVGSILTWKSSTAIQRGDSDQPRQKSWIIDGQQRTTALCTLFDKRPDWWDNNRSSTWNAHINAFDIRLDIGEEELTFATRKAPELRYIPVRDILASDDLYALAENLVGGGQSFTGSVGTLAGRLQEVTKIKQAILPTVEIDDTIELTEVAEILKRLNSTGTRVQQADIYLGVVASRNPGWVNQNFLKFIDELDDQGFEIEPAFLFRSFTGIGVGKSRFRDIDPDFWENLGSSMAWDTTQKALRSVCQGLRQYGIINSHLTLSSNAIVAAAVWRARFPQGPLGEFLSWMLNAVKEGFFSGPTETKLDRVINAIQDKASSAEALHGLDALLNNPPQFTPEEFIETGSGRNSVQRLMIYLLAFRNNAEDWNTNGYKIRAEAVNGYEPEWHHIFPRKWLRDNVPDIERKLIDSVANMAVISAGANRKIAAKAPKDYISELNLAARGLLDQQAIPDPTFVEPNQYKDWLRTRAERFIPVRPLMSVMGLAPHPSGTVGPGIQFLFGSTPR
jgi:hypothetical protein